mmetsp:Transcript_11401/g.23076  ORF Transcript_11401/g.23076 Transcript_11401/m.23076 type:complete len:231 (-) Transcript_11401:1325-2017(-)
MFGFAHLSGVLKWREQKRVDGQRNAPLSGRPFIAVQVRPWVMMASAEPDGQEHSLPARLARSFIEACLPSERPYVEALQNFIATAIQAFRAGYSVQTLQMEIAAETGSDRATMLPRPLRDDEVELRSMWLSLVFKTLRAASGTTDEPSGGPSSSSSAAAPASFDPFDAFVANVIRAFRAGSNFERMKLEQSLSVGAQGTPQRTAEEAAILLQSTRIVVLTLEYLSSNSSA